MNAFVNLWFVQPTEQFFKLQQFYQQIVPTLQIQDVLNFYCGTSVDKLLLEKKAKSFFLRPKQSHSAIESQIQNLINHGLANQQLLDSYLKEIEASKSQPGCPRCNKNKVIKKYMTVIEKLEQKLHDDVTETKHTKHYIHLEELNLIQLLNLCDIEVSTTAQEICNASMFRSWASGANLENIELQRLLEFQDYTFEQYITFLVRHFEKTNNTEQIQKLYNTLCAPELKRKENDEWF